MSKKRALTPHQQDYANAIIDAGLAERDEVENAFRERSEESEARIAMWGSVLTQKRKEVQQAFLRRLQTQEQCAYPGCSNVIEVKRSWKDDPGTPRPTRTLTLTMQMEGWHWEGWNKVENTKTSTLQFWGCSPEHQEGIFRLEFALTPTLGERTDQNDVQYPMSSETQWRVYELARQRARDLVAHAKDLTELPHIRRTIMLVAQQEVEALIAVSSDLARLTDDLDQFRTTYTQEFVEGYLEGLRARRTYRMIIQ